MFKIENHLTQKQLKGKNHYGKCTDCGKDVEWRRDRVSNHVLKGCTKATAAKKENFNNFKKRKTISDVMTDISFSNNSIGPEESISNVSGPAHEKLDRYFKVITDEFIDDLDMKVAGFFYETAIPFNVADSDSFKEIFRTACPGYTPPSSKKLRTRLLDKTLKGLDEEMKFLVEKAPVVSIVSDGWSNIRNDHLVNFVVTIPNCKPILYKAIDTTEISQTGGAIYQELNKVIQEIGPEKICSVVTDNASNMQAAWKLIEQEYPKMFANGCAAHVLNLLVKDILQISNYEEALRHAVEVSKFVKSRGALCKEFRTIQAKSSSLKKRFLSLPVETRWYTQFHCIKNVLDNRESLSMICVTNAFREKYFNIDSGKCFKALIDSDEFWSNLQKLALILKPICDGIGMMEKDKCFLSDVYKTFLDLLSHTALQDENVRELVENRPQAARGGDMFGNDKRDTLQQLKSYMEKTDSGSSVEVDNYLEDWAYASDSFITDAKKQSPVLTWRYYFARKFPKLYVLARRLFSIPTSSAASERVWSVFSFVHSKKRCRLLNDTVMKLAKVYVNTSISRMETSKSTTKKAIDYFKDLSDEIEEDEEDDLIDIF